MLGPATMACVYEQLDQCFCACTNGSLLCAARRNGIASSNCSIEQAMRRRRRVGKRTYGPAAVL
jgi:hypothetical protein